MKRKMIAWIAALCLLGTAGCGNSEQAGKTENTPVQSSPATNEIAEIETSDPSSSAADDELENLIGVYDYLSDYGTGKLMIEKTSSGYDISDHESESSYRFLANSSNIEAIEDNKVYIKYPEEVFSDGTVIFSYYTLEYSTDEINVYYGRSAHEDTQFLYCATRENTDK